MAQSPFGADSTPTCGAATEKYRYKCPAVHQGQRADLAKMAGFDVERNGSTWTIKGSTKAVHVNIGVLGAIKDAGRDTKKNLETFANWFKQNKVDIVVANGDIALDEFDLEEVFLELGKRISR